MLSYIHGIILSKNENSLIVLAGDLGYRVFVNERILSRVNVDEEVDLYLHHHIREDASDLYGFENDRELEMFEYLISVSGIGPKTALSALSLSSVAKIQQAIIRGDAGLLKQVSGIGPKTAERIVMELKDKFKGVSISAQTDEDLMADNESIEALVGLGYTVVQARQAMNNVPASIKGVQDRLKAALKELGRN